MEVIGLSGRSDQKRKSVAALNDRCEVAFC